MSVRIVTSIVTAIPTTESDVSTPYRAANPHLHLANTNLSNSAFTARLHSGGDESHPSATLSFSGSAAPRSTTSLTSQTLFVSSDLFPLYRPETPALTTPPPPQTKIGTVIVTATPKYSISTPAKSEWAVPTEYLSQVPSGWPYTKLGVGRRGNIVSWGLTDRDEKTVAEVRHYMQWWPRPLWTGIVESEGQRGLLEEWRPTFVVAEGAVESTPTEDGE